MDVEIKTAGKTTEKISDVPASVILVTRQDIQRYGYTQLSDILRHVSGMYLIDFYGLGGSAYGVRGYLNPGVSRNMIILINGIDQVFDYASSYFLSSMSIPVEAIDRIEIVRGPQSTIYGSGAFFGVINIITNELHQEQGVASSVTASLGTDGLHKRTVPVTNRKKQTL
jgi:outer membrane receptor for ferrienterochelin and colicins